MVETATMQQLLVHETKEEHEYDRERVLRVWEAIKEEVGAGWFGDNGGYVETESTTDDDRIIMLFDLLAESTFGDWLFSSVNHDRGCDLVERDPEA